jgi:hypothetical protein
MNHHDRTHRCYIHHRLRQATMILERQTLLTLGQSNRAKRQQTHTVVLMVDQTEAVSEATPVSYSYRPSWSPSLDLSNNTRLPHRVPRHWPLQRTKWACEQLDFTQLNKAPSLDPTSPSAVYLPCHYFDYMAGTSTGGYEGGITPDSQSC